MDSSQKDKEDLNELPVTEVLADLVSALAAEQAVVLRAPPGAGKTTAVPPAILKSKVTTGKTLLIQPRRLAARTAAARLAERMDTKLGDVVGYQVRFDNRSHRDTRLISMTTGILLRRLQSDPLLEDVDCVLLDEFHERSVELDLALGMLTRIRNEIRPDLKLVVMSATLDPEPIVDFLGNAVNLESEGRSFPVDVVYSPAFSSERIETQVLGGVQQATRQTDGHVLVFLPGVGEIRRCHRSLSDFAEQHTADIHELYGDLSPEKQDAVLLPSQRRKIILATNVAETSITIDGVTAVVDSGQARSMSFDANLGLPRLHLQPISKASADQRAGRAGRTAPGVAFRLWPEASHRSRPDRDVPEIQRCDFSGPLLTLSAWGERDVHAFPWLTPPPGHAVDQATSLLRRLGAIDRHGVITEMGNQMMAFALPPRLARFMLACCQSVNRFDAAIVAALLTEKDPFRGSSFSLFERVERLKDFDAKRQSIEQPASGRHLIRVAKQIQRQVPTELRKADSVSVGWEPLAKALLLAFPDRLARRRPHDPSVGVMVGGRGVQFAAAVSRSEAELHLCLDVDSAATEAKVRIAVPIDRDWLPTEHVHESTVPQFDLSLQAVTMRRQRRFDDLLLGESPIKCEPSEQVAAILADAARPNLDRLLRSCSKELVRWMDRVRFLNREMPQADLPVLDDSAIDEVLVLLCQSRTKISQLEKAPWLDHLKGRYDYRQHQWIDQHAPGRFALPSGNTVAIDYDGGVPKLDVRIQELFGLPSTPRVAGGRIPIKLRLLGPNYRPQQITDDLENFWAETYHHVRKELRGRYPKHHWPEDPTTAKATPKGLKPR